MFPKTKTTSHKNWSRNASIGSARYDAVSNINPRTGWSADMRLPAFENAFSRRLPKMKTPWLAS